MCEGIIIFVFSSFSSFHLTNASVTKAGLVVCRLDDYVSVKRIGTVIVNAETRCIGKKSLLQCYVVHHASPKIGLTSSRWEDEDFCPHYQKNFPVLTYADFCSHYQKNFPVLTYEDFCPHYQKNFPVLTYADFC
jgi:hypothetical protein